MQILVYALITGENIDEFLLLKRPSTKKHMPDYWNLPGGNLEEHESLEYCAIREVKEETSLNFTPEIRLLDKIYYSNEIPFRVIVFAGKTFKGNIKLSHEHVDFKFVTKEELERILVMPYIKELFTNVEV